MYQLSEHRIDRFVKALDGLTERFARIAPSDAAVRELLNAAQEVAIEIRNQKMLESDLSQPSVPVQQMPALPPGRNALQQSPPGEACGKPVNTIECKRPCKLPRGHEGDCNPF